MTNPSDPGQPQRPPAPGGPAGPYGPPPQPHPGNIPNPRPPAPGPTPAPGLPYQPPQQEWSPREDGGKGFFGALLDTNFDHLVTPRLIKVFYVMALLMVSLSALMMAATGIWVAQLRNGWLLGLIIVCGSPVLWFFEAILVRIFLEAVVVRFKGAEYLRIIKDKI